MPDETAWRALGNAAVEDNPFLAPSFLKAALRHVATAPVDVISFGSSGPQVVAPMVAGKLGHLAPAYRVWSHAYAPLGVPLIEDGEPTAAVESFLGNAVGAQRSLVMENFRLDGEAVSVFRAAAEKDGRPVAIMGETARAVLSREAWQRGEAGMGALGGRVRQKRRRQMRRLADLGEVAFSTARAPEDVRGALGRFLALEAAGWKGRAGTALASTTATTQFAREAVLAGAANGDARIDTLSVGGIPAAMAVTLLAGRSAFVWKVAFDEDLAKHSPGVQLMLGLTDRLFDDARLERVDSCAVAGHPMIEPLWPERMRIGKLIVGPRGGGPLYRLAIALEKAEDEGISAGRALRDRIAS